MIFQLGIFLLLTSFYAAYFLKQIILKKQGIATNRLAKGQKPSRTEIVEKLLLIITYLNAAAQYISVFLGSYFGAYMFPAIIRYFGLFLAACGVLFFILAIVHMQNNWRAGVDETQKTQIVTTGIYKYSRNPAFVGFDLLYIGTALAIPNLVLFVLAVLGVALLHQQILEEEKYLPKAFGEDYLQYKKAAPRYFLFF